ncbi:ArsR/SmtB family transcription factor [Alloalcanivorax gelatiniphagus]|uniref:Metalloregulator ArsR/SmtB family transcription factor n=1 Tax=Alloalcanivorax gelatiniphagus TaxID=1194167 RepID=A0ABY2XI51_9GAMM|nr:metalloregulator ArsR/SmtB family transcription factor [Alloalcanivorax gelatiniphagus]TMW11442.1 metalloregulator ArsR/SmtB family transcription factor [Alloalcanivorax gelatiniphagus]
MHAIHTAPARLTAAELCKCLGEELRLSLLCLMAVDREVCVCDLVAALEAPQSTISRHLALLRQCGLVVARRQGTWMHYRIDDSLPEWALTIVEELVRQGRQDLDLKPLSGRCC